MVIKINNKEYSNIPQSFEELDFERFSKFTTALQTYKNNELDLQIFCILVGCTIEEVKESTEIKNYLDYILEVGSWNFQKIDYTKISTPDKFQFDKVPYILPKDLGDFELGLFEDCRNELKNKDLQKLDVLQDVCLTISSLYIYKLIYKEYDYKKAMEIKSKVALLNWQLVIGFGIFFLQKTTELLSGTMKELNTSSLHKKKGKQAMNGLRKIWAWFWSSNN